MTATNLGQKFSQTYPSTTIYWHTCKFTRKPFCSPIRRLTYSPEGERLKREYDEAIKAGRKLVCPVYFYKCPETGNYFTTRIQSSRWSKEGKRIVKERELAWTKEYRQREQVKERERKRLGSEVRRVYKQTWDQDNKERLSLYRKRINDSKPKSCPVYFLTCEVTGKLFTSKHLKAKYSQEGRRIKDRLNHLANRKQRHCTCKQCGNAFTPALGSKNRTYCSSDCADTALYLKSRIVKNYRLRAIKYNVPYDSNINPLAVFERDGWHCYLCGIPTPKQKRGLNEPDSPELDHIIPMSKGGGHVVSNVACACRNCNGKKSNKILTV